MIISGLWVAVPVRHRRKAHVLVSGSFWSEIQQPGRMQEQRCRRGGRRCPSGLGFEVWTLPTNSDARTQPFTTPMLTPTEKESNDVWLAQEELRVRMCGHVWRVRRIRRKPKSKQFEGFLTWESIRVQNSVPSGRRGKFATRHVDEYVILFEYHQCMREAVAVSTFHDCVMRDTARGDLYNFCVKSFVCCRTWMRPEAYV